MWDAGIELLKALAFVGGSSISIILLIVGFKIWKNSGSYYSDHDYRSVPAMDRKTNRWKIVRVPTEFLISRILR